MRKNNDSDQASLDACLRRPATRVSLRGERQGEAPLVSPIAFGTQRFICLLMVFFLVLFVFEPVLILGARDLDNDGFPDAAELIDEAERSRFRRWFVAIAESQFYAIHPQWPAIRRDCTGLICFAYKEAMKTHDGTWLKGFKYITEPATADLEGFRYPNVPILKTNLFRTNSAPFSDDDIGNGIFQPIATAQVLMQYNCRFLGKETNDDIKAGDLLFFRYFVDERMVYHTMILVKKVRGSHNPGNGASNGNGDGIVVYHTGPDGASKGEVRKTRISLLNMHSDDTWHIKPNNPKFLGFYRLKIVDYDYLNGGDSNE